MFNAVFILFKKSVVSHECDLGWACIHNNTKRTCRSITSSKAKKNTVRKPLGPLTSEANAKPSRLEVRKYNNFANRQLPKFEYFFLQPLRRKGVSEYFFLNNVRIISRIVTYKSVVGHGLEQASSIPGPLRNFQPAVFYCAEFKCIFDVTR